MVLLLLLANFGAYTGSVLFYLYFNFQPHLIADDPEFRAVLATITFPQLIILLDSFTLFETSYVSRIYFFEIFVCMIFLVSRRYWLWLYVLVFFSTTSIMFLLKLMYKTG